jgi:hypothetical protein
VAPCPVKEALLGAGSPLHARREAGLRQAPALEESGLEGPHTEQGLLNSIERIVQVRCVLAGLEDRPTKEVSQTAQGTYVLAETTDLGGSCPSRFRGPLGLGDPTPSKVS